MAGQSSVKNLILRVQHQENQIKSGTTARIRTKLFKKIQSDYLESSVCGSCTFSMIVLFLFHCDSEGLAAAKIDVRAFNWQIIPAFAMLRVCCSIT